MEIKSDKGKERLLFIPFILLGHKTFHAKRLIGIFYKWQKERLKFRLWIIDYFFFLSFYFKNNYRLFCIWSVHMASARRLHYHFSSPRRIQSCKCTQLPICTAEMKEKWKKKLFILCSIYFHNHFKNHTRNIYKTN